MRKLSILLVCLITMLAGCSKSTDSEDSKVRPVHIQLTNQNHLEHWKLVMLPNTRSPGQQTYDIEIQNAGETSAESVTVYYRVDTKEKLSGTTVKADSTTAVSKLDPNEKITLLDLTFPIDTPISLEVVWLEGNHISRGSGAFMITEIK
ncbi:MAG: hypothetical protein K0Q73_7835 [Paenibacillus sp.]|nr:hypothetical protein [Paenibacillus sp.]